MLAARTPGDPSIIFTTLLNRIQKFQILPALNELKHEHTINYQNALTGGNASPDIQALYNDPRIKMIVPFGSEWTVSVNSFWTMVNSYVRRIVQASNCRVEELLEADLSFARISEQKKQAMYV
jgi:hypothetical protein